MAARATRGFGQYSGVARAVERVGERWALLIVRDLLAGARRYSDLKAGLPRIPTNILSDRLKELQEAGVIRRVPTVRGGYELTALGRGLEPVVLALERWGWSALGEPAEGEVLTADALAVALRAAFQADVSRTLPSTEYVLHVADVSISAVVADGALDVVAIGPGALPQPRRRLAAPPPADVLELAVDVAGFRPLLGDGPRSATVLAGGDELLERFLRTFRITPDPGVDAAHAADESSVA
ncbi:winged helix-turn-helix transcriptional regulator [Agromyces aerolatus]|uniref:winged helix-turn-helix transcriptional regulator n=1 Tax=Agromyces sp. LY-1074 TaxID=3074080 RepID=UPI00285B6EEC|nr:MULTISPECIES: winged helix-turn-helix transcriptional regulator [unclassified Agromyces]MDR5701225.1 winged helix-turn-helix transcriptional regulator [Agromyces sp. LY-1074]MDR5706899.1 winged helix-turn-helix transcriptional regulator [Agromyces sp. LY-1358]